VLNEKWTKEFSCNVAYHFWPWQFQNRVEAPERAHFVREADHLEVVVKHIVGLKTEHGFCLIIGLSKLIICNLFMSQ